MGGYVIYSEVKVLAVMAFMKTEIHLCQLTDEYVSIEAFCMLTDVNIL